MVTKKGKEITGKKYVKQRKKRKYEIAGQKRAVKLGEDARKNKKTRGGNKKVFLIKSKLVNVKSGNKILKTIIRKVIETPSNKFLARQNIITKGTILDTELGKVRVTNRPSQEGMINGILFE